MGSTTEHSRRCVQSFHELCTELGAAKPQHLLLMPLDTIKGEQGKFKVWCGNIGALQSGYASLDYRLRESEVMQVNVVKLLQQLQRTLLESEYRQGTFTEPETALEMG